MTLVDKIGPGALDRSSLSYHLRLWILKNVFDAIVPPISSKVLLQSKLNGRWIDQLDHWHLLLVCHRTWPWCAVEIGLLSTHRKQAFVCLNFGSSISNGFSTPNSLPTQSWACVAQHKHHSQSMLALDVTGAYLQAFVITVYVLICYCTCFSHFKKQPSRKEHCN